MTSQAIRWGIAAAVVQLAVAAPARADSFDLIQISYGVNTGARIIYGPYDFTDGLFIERPVWDYLANKTYSSQVIQFGTGEKNESYLQYIPGTDQWGFTSAQASGTTLEVGVNSRIGVQSFGVAASRMNLTIKNNHEDRSLDLLEFAFEIPAGELLIRDFSQSFIGLGVVEATIDYFLLSPAGEFGGTYDKTTGHLFDYFVELNAGVLSKSGNATVTRAQNLPPTLEWYLIDEYKDKLRLPVIPPLGELTVYYDMYALMALWPEMLGRAFLGDPTDLAAAGGFSLTVGGSEPEPDPVPEPAALTMLGAGLLALSRRLMAQRHTR